MKLIFVLPYFGMMVLTNETPSDEDDTYNSLLIYSTYYTLAGTIVMLSVI